tara:strand:- start:160 stop:477 length:318 start_codon:yes stop_codon:yes gene_type:complete
MIDADRLELVDTGDGVPLTKCEQNLYEALANLHDGIGDTYQETVKRLEDALADMGDLVAEARSSRLRPTVTVDDYHKRGDLYVTVYFPNGEQYVGLVEKWEGDEE